MLFNWSRDEDTTMMSLEPNDSKWGTKEVNSPRSVGQGRDEVGMTRAVERNVFMAKGLSAYFFSQLHPASAGFC